MSIQHALPLPFLKLLTLLMASLAISASAQGTSHIGRYESKPQDTEAILQVTRDFQAALAGKDAKKLSALLLNSKILFDSPASPARVLKRKAEVDAHFDGVNPAGASSLLDLIAKSKEVIEEKFYNIKITQDGHLAWVMFDFEFIEAGQVKNHGLEVWQLLKTDDSTWKILSVVWSSHGSPK